MTCGTTDHETQATSRRSIRWLFALLRDAWVSFTHPATNKDPV